jgi:hypothetical protein
MALPETPAQIMLNSNVRKAVGLLWADLETFLTGNAPIPEECQMWPPLLAFRIAAPKAPQRASFEIDNGADPVPVVQSMTLNTEDVPACCFWFRSHLWYQGSR